jgi:hypothetical protein
LYKSIVVPKLLYGVSVWSNCLTKRWCINKLRTTQYQILKSITRSYKSAHKESLLIISNLLPIDLIAFEFAALRYFAYKNLEFSISSAKAIEFTFSDCGLVNVSTVLTTVGILKCFGRGRNGFFRGRRMIMCRRRPLIDFISGPRGGDRHRNGKCLKVGEEAAAADRYGLVGWK